MNIMGLVVIVGLLVSVIGGLMWAIDEYANKILEWVDEW